MVVTWTIPFCDWIAGNSRLKNLKPNITPSRAGDRNQDVLVLAGSLKQNKGLVKLDL
jgi:hypothetical protein